MGRTLDDIRLGLRSIMRQPGLSAIAIVCLALGIGANTAIFSVVHALVLRALPFPEASRIMTVWSTYERDGNNPTTVSPANFIDWKTHSTAFEAMAVYGGVARNLTGAETPRRLVGSRVSAGFFETMGVMPELGRPFTVNDDRPDAEPAVILSHDLWREVYHGDASLVGQRIELSEVPHLVLGVMPEGFDFPPDREFWMPAAFSAEEAARRDLIYLQVVGRLKPGVNEAQAQGDMDVVCARLREAYPEANLGLGAALVPLQEHLVEDFEAAVFVLLGAVGLVLLIACANVANLLLVKGAARRREMGIRSALGAGRWRLIRQLLTESVVLALVGGLCGVLVARWGIDALTAFFAGRLPAFVAEGIELSGPVLIFALAVSVVTGLLFGFAPAITNSHIDLASAMKDRDSAATFTGRLWSLRSLLVVGEIAVTFVLLIGAALLSQSLQRLLDSDTGFDSRQVLTMSTSLPTPRYEADATQIDFFDAALRRIRARPDVVSAGAALTLPFSGNSMGYGYLIEGRPEPEPGAGLGALFDVVTPGYLETLRIPLLRGRLIDERDTARSRRIAVISETMAAEGWPDEDPLGQRITIGEGDTEEEWMEIVGIVGDIQHYNLGEELMPRMYFPHAQRPFSQMYFCVRTERGMETLEGVRRAVAEVDPDQPLSNVQMMDDAIAEQAALPRVTAWLSGGFAAAALLLATVGLYGVMSFGVTQRTREIGVRMALGSPRRDVIGLFLRQGLLVSTAGMVVGVAAALAASRFIASQLYDVAPSDPATYLVTVAALGAASLLAVLVPARRATRIDPMVALRHE